MPPTRVAVYVRMSKDRQEDSPERQRGQVEPHCDRQGYQIVDEYLDPGITGDEFVKRAAFQRLLRDAKAGKFDGIVVDAKDRISRQHPIDYISDVVRPLRDAGVWVEAVATGRLDWDSMAGLLTDHIQQHQASDEPVSIAYRTLTSLLGKARNGQGAGGPPPYAYVMTYREEMVTNTKGDRTRLKRIPVKYALGEAFKVEVVQWLFREYATGRRSIEQLRDELHARCVRGPRGTEWWGKSTIVRILGNRRYLGDWVYNRQHCGKWAVAEGGAVRKSTGGRKVAPQRNAEADWVVVPDWHPAIIDRETFALVQARLQQNRERKTPVIGGGNFALAGLLVCGQCGLPMWGFNERDECKYRCSGNQRFGGAFCGTNTVRESVVLPAIVDGLQTELLNPEFFEEAMAAVRRELEEARESGALDTMQTRIETLDKQIDQGNANLALLPAALVPGVAVKVQDMKDERDRLAAERERLTGAADVSDTEAIIAEAKQVLWNLRAAAEEGDPADVRLVLREYVSRIVLDFRPRARRNRSPLTGGMIYLRDESAESHSVDSLPMRSHSKRPNGLAIRFEISA